MLRQAGRGASSLEKLLSCPKMPPHLFRFVGQSSAMSLLPRPNTMLYHYPTLHHGLHTPLFCGITARESLCESQPLRLILTHGH